MFNLKLGNTEPTKLDEEIDRLYSALEDLDPSDEDYDAASDQLLKLSKLQIETNSKKRVSPDVLVGAAANLFGIILVLQWEHVHVITSKAFSMVSRNIK